MTLTLRLGEVCGVRLCKKENQPFLKARLLASSPPHLLASPPRSWRKVREPGLVREKVLHILKADLYQGTLSFGLGEDEFSK